MILSIGVKLKTKRHRASCGHDIEDGIDAVIDDGNGTAFGTWCVECLKMWNEEGRLNNEELEQILTEHDIMKDALEMIASWNTKNTREAWMSLGIDKLVEVMKNDTEIARQALQELEEGEEE
jgi:hypothetical protein